jgi:hypothetical protein
MPVTVELRGGPLCGTLYTIKDYTLPIIETINGIRYTYRAVRIRKTRPIMFECTWAAVVDPMRLVRRDQAIADECHTDEAA